MDACRSDIGPSPSLQPHGQGTVTLLQQLIRERLLVRNGRMYRDSLSVTPSRFSMLATLVPTLNHSPLPKRKGETEFYVDGTCIHILNDAGEPVYGEMKVGEFIKRERSDGCTLAECGTRELLEPTVVSAFAAIENKEEFQKRCQNERRRLGVGSVTSALGDGALWISARSYTPNSGNPRGKNPPNV